MSTASLLWSLHPPGGHTSWLFGTMHVTDKRAYRFVHRLLPLIRESDSYIGEMDLNASDVIPVTPAYDIRSFFSESEFEKINKQFKKSFNLDLVAFGHLHPLVIMGAITQSILMKDHAVSLDEYLWQYAGSQGVKLSGLESVHEQMDILHSIEPGHVYRQIKYISQHPSAIRKQTSRSLELYMQGEVHELYKQTKSSLHNLRKKVIYLRNDRMATRISELHWDQTYFIAIGAGHLSGQKGLVRLLRQRDWKVKPVPWPGDPLQV